MHDLILHHQEFGEHGWTTLFLEDFANWGLCRPGIRGFRTPPTDHYYRTTYMPLVREKGLKGEHMLNDPTGPGVHACQQELPIHTHQFRILHDLLLHQEGPTFSFLHLSEYTHDYLKMATYYDEPTNDLIGELSRSGLLNDTFFLLLGDHGYQRGENPFTSTKQVWVTFKTPRFKCPRERTN